MCEQASKRDTHTFFFCVEPPVSHTFRVQTNPELLPGSPLEDDDFPEGIEQNNVLYSLPYDLNQRSKKIKGHCVVDRTYITNYVDDRQQDQFRITDYDEFVCEQLIGCCILLGKKDEKTRFICALTHTYFLKFAEMCKLLNHYLMTGEPIATTDADEPACPRCGLPLDGAKTCPYCAKKSAYLFRLVKRTAQYKGFFIASVVATICANLIWVVIPFLERAFIDDYITPLHAVDRRFIMMSVGMLLMVAATWLFDFVNMKASSTVALCLGRDLRQELFQKTQHLSMSSVSKRTPGDLINRVNHDAGRLQDFITANGKEAIVRLFSVVILGILLLLIMKNATKYFQQAFPKYDALNASVQENVSAIRVVKAYVREEEETKKFKNASENIYNIFVKAEKNVLYNSPLMQFTVYSCILLISWIGAKMIVASTLTTGELMSLLAYCMLNGYLYIWFLNTLGLDF